MAVADMQKDTDIADDGVKLTAKRVFELFVETLRTERDVADQLLLIRLRWYVKDVEEALLRLEDAPRAARPLMHGLTELINLLELEAARVEVMEENVHQATRWALLLPEIKIRPSGDEADVSEDPTHVSNRNEE